MAKLTGMDPQPVESATDETPTTFLGEYGSGDGSEDPDKERSLMMVRLCQRLITKCPAFISSYGIWLARFSTWRDSKKEAVRRRRAGVSGLHFPIAHRVQGARPTTRTEPSTDSRITWSWPVTGWRQRSRIAGRSPFASRCSSGGPMTTLVFALSRRRRFGLKATQDPRAFCSTEAIKGVFASE